ncbi:MAG: hypothetical protein AAFU68_04970 [Pseudomonadota bacterium]
MKIAHRRAHRRIWTVLALLIPAMLASAFALKQDFAAAPAPVQIAPPAAGGDQ